MGRGRAKAKQTKVARELKYHSPNTDLTALQRELAGTTRQPDRHDDDNELVDDDEDDAAEDQETWDDQETWSPSRRS
ncbi:DUF3073 domain-containing protein [Actinoplanes derwentensis]|uniref:DUF3073 domain-containing protein n=1 Tax=Actinoplanes derwentensis TaxID=113562 RepID=A0A1H2CRJ3_9ACTN|nr:DUF3073 domain-containing protein [Actinoplanes derwentensis]GID85451.1 hypothetical protein Ade03nite_43750 [Actinoplanes derwentensis]SDT73165.1 Protein of unknown function [Actinoplanes derwentensis]